MASAKATIDLPVSAEEVWNLIGGFGSLPNWLPFISKSDMSNGGQVRRLEDPDGHPIIEQLQHYDHAGRSYSYSILESPFPIVDYLAKITVSSTGGGRTSHVEWTGTFTPKGVSDAVVRALFQTIFSNGLSALAARYENRR